MKFFTIGFTQKSAETFFSKLKSAGVETLYDIRLNNVSQLAGFTKRDDLRYFLSELCQIDYVHMPELAPSQDILKAYKDGLIDWQAYEEQFTDLLSERRVEHFLDPLMFEHCCFLCSEPMPDRCHRRLVAEYLIGHWGHHIQLEHL